MPNAVSGMAGQPAPIIFSCAGLTLSEEEKNLFEKTQPAGFILFKRNCDTPDQVKHLITSLNATCRHSALQLIDQEGGAVARLTPPHWQVHPPANHYGKLYTQDPTKAREAAHAGAKKIAESLRLLGFNINCLPVLDVPVQGADKIIGTRAYSDQAPIVADLGAAAARGLKAGGILPVIKHLPGHGRATQDSHKHLPIVEASLDELEATDFIPFLALKDELLAMTAHIVYRALDPALPATFSKRIIEEIVRGQFGFKGLLLSDDINMAALTGALPDRAHRALAAGCDLVLHCSGQLDEMTLLAQHLPPLTKGAAARLDKVLGVIDDTNLNQS